LKIEKKYEILTRFYQTVSGTLELEVLSDNIFSALLTVFPDVARIAIHLIKPEMDQLSLYRQNGHYQNTAKINLAAMVAEKCQPVFSGRLGEDLNGIDQINSSIQFESYAGLPLEVENKLIGVVELFAVKQDLFSKSDKALLKEISTIVGIVLNNGLHHEESSNRAKRFIGISRAISVSRNLSTINEVLRDISKVLVQTLGFDHAWIGLYSPDTETVNGVAGFGRFLKKKQMTISFAAGESVNNPVIKSLTSQKAASSRVESKIKVDSTFSNWLQKLNAYSYGFVPISNDSGPLGVIGAFFGQQQDFNKEDIKILISVAEQAAIAIENAHLYEQVKISEKNYRTLFEAAGTCLAIVNNKNFIQLVNDAFLSLCRCKPAELVLKKKFNDFIFSDNDSEQISLQKILKNQNSWEGGFRTFKNDLRQVHVTAALIPDSDQTLVSIIDMTRERELERRLFRSEELAAIGELSAGIAHEIRNPLVAITTSVSLLSDEPKISEDGRELLEVVKEESDHLAVIVDDFLRFARPQKPTLREENINKLLTDVIKKTTEFADKHIEIKKIFHNELPMTAIDRHQIQQVITNLINNGIDACGENGCLTISSGLIRENKSVHVVISIEDTGIGIPDDEINKIFQPFFSTKTKGTGMGLAICQRIIDSHEGEITVYSKVGKGTVFSLTLPLEKDSLI